MAKSTGLLGVFSGKLGNAVGYVLKNSNNNQLQGLRTYQPVVSNPQTDPQMLQRIKLKAVNNFYRALKPIISRGFEGVKYGDASRRKFQSLALGRDFQGPYLPKGSTLALPLVDVPIALGSLRPVSFSSISGADATAGMGVTNVTTTVTVPAAPTITTLANIMLGAGYQEGDQLTLIVFGMDNGYPYHVEHSAYMVTDDTTPLSDVGIKIAVSAGNLLIGATDIFAPFAVALIMSREGSHLRSTTRFFIDADTLASEYYSPSDLSDIISSYLTAASRSSSDWPTVPGGSGSASGVVVAKTAAGDTVTVTGLQKVGSYLMGLNKLNAAKYYFINDNDTAEQYGKYLASLTETTYNAPAGITDGTKLLISNKEDASAEEKALYSWLLNQGVSAAIIA